MSDWILVVDDDTQNLKIASRILSGEKLRVSCLKSGGDTIKFLQENRPDLILLDIHMPGMDGFETIMACDLGAYPFGFILNLTPEIEFEYGTSLMNLFDAVYDKEYSMNWPLMYLERTNDIIPIPLLFKPLPNVDE